jgi:multiple sugar transport system permease protein
VTAARLRPHRLSRHPLRPRPIVGYLFIAPALVFFLAYTFYPVLRSLWLSFTDEQFASFAAVHFVGLDNYVRALQDPYVTGGLIRALWFTVLFYPGAIILPLGLALILDRVGHERASATYRVLLYIPAIIPAPLIFALWLWMYGPTTGLFNQLLVDQFHVVNRGLLWTADPSTAMISVAIMEWWWSLGQMSVFFLVGLRSIPQDLYEAARIDGAGELKVVRHITLPLLRPTIMTWVLLKVAAFAVLVEMLVFQGRGDSLVTWARYAWEQGFTFGQLNVSYGSAIGWVGAAAMVVLVLVLYRVLRSDPQ